MVITLKAARVNAGLTQQQVAKEMKWSKSTINAVETGKRELRISELDALCQLYKCGRDDIFLPQKLA